MVQISRIFFAFWALFFILFGYWQWNDPDPEVWISIYGFAAIMSALAYFKRFFVPLLIISAVAALLGALYFFPPSVSNWIAQEWQQGDLSMKTVNMEEARESFGLLLVSLVMGLAAYAGWLNKREKNNDRNKI